MFGIKTLSTSEKLNARPSSMSANPSPV